MKRTIFRRLLSTYTVLIGGLSLFLLLFTFRAIRTYYIEILTGHLERLAVTTGRVMAQAGPGADIDSLADTLGKRLGVRITVIAGSGDVLGDSEENPADMENHANRPEILYAMRGQRGQVLRHSTTVGQEMLYVALREEGLPGGPGVIRVSVFLSAIASLLGNIRGTILVSTAVVIALALLTAYLFARTISRPIRQLTHASRKIAAGDFNAKVFLDRADELKELADSFNIMTDDLQKLVRELSRQKEELNTIIGSIKEGLLVLDADGIVLLCNASFNKLFGVQNAEGRRYWELSREQDFISFIESVQEKESNHTGEITLDGRDYRMSATYIPGRGDQIVLVHDVTEMRHLETIKRDFVTNVSHELRTPLTAIKGFAETLAEEAAGPQKRYVDIISNHTQRLIHIVEDLLRLSELDEGRLDDLAETDLAGLLRSVGHMLEMRVRKKGLELLLDLPDGQLTVQADAFRLEQVFINLVDNAVKYTEQGGVTVKAGSGGTAVTVTVSDTGIGIPPGSRERIFERFYVVDKSRSRQSGGTGLGLSIVKHIISLHGGTVSVSDNPPGGTVFTVSLPVHGPV